MIPWDIVLPPSSEFGPKVLERLTTFPARKTQGQYGSDLVLFSNQVGHTKCQDISAPAISKYIPTYFWLITNQSGHINQVGDIKVQGITAPGTSIYVPTYFGLGESHFVYIFSP